MHWYVCLSVYVCTRVHTWYFIMIWQLGNVQLNLQVGLGSVEFFCSIPLYRVERYCDIIIYCSVYNCLHIEKVDCSIRVFQ